jgi:ABC-type Na+ efflux pump permease subunit
MEEKTNRIVEVIISSVKPFELMMGKITGIAMVALLQFLIGVAGNASAVVDSAVVLVVMATVATCRSRSTSRATANSKATNLRASAGTTTSPMASAAGTNLADGRSSTAFKADGSLSISSHKANSRSSLLQART